MDLLSTVGPWVNGGAVGFAAFVGSLVFLGRLLPAATVDRIVDPYKERLAASEKALALEIERGERRDQQNSKLLEAVNTTNSLLASLSRPERTGQ